MTRKILLLFMVSFIAFNANAQSKKLFDKMNTDPNMAMFPPVICPIGEGHSDHYVPPTNKKRITKSSSANGLEIIVEYTDEVFVRGVQPIFDDFITPLLAETFTSNIPLRIRVGWSTEDSFLAATGNPYVRNLLSLPRQNTFYPIAIAEKILDRHINDPDAPDMTVTINGNIDWYYAWFRPENVGNRFDLGSTLYHEIYHGLGFATLSDLSDGDEGSLRLTFNSQPNGPFTPHVFSHFLETGPGEPLLNFEDGPELGALFTGGDLFIRTPLFPDTSRAEIYAPAAYSGGSSLSHFDEATFNRTESALMTPSSGRGEIERAAGLADSVLYDLGWQYTSIVHEHPDTIEGVREDFVVKARIVSDFPVDESSLMLHYVRAGQNNTVTVPMIKGSDGVFTESIPANGSERDFNYYMTINTTDGRQFTNPGQAPEAAMWTHSFGFDEGAPSITHTPVERISEADRFIDLVVDEVSDEFTGPGTPQVEWRLNGQSFGTEDMRLELLDEFSFAPVWQYTIEIPQDIELDETDNLEYRIIVSDKSIAKNTTTSPSSGYYQLTIEPVPDPLVQYFADFSEEELGFISNGLYVQRPAGFSNEVMVGTDHPYEAAGAGNTVDFIYQLEAPLIISADDPTIKFDEIVIVETGEPGTKFGDQEFWDYVIVEGLKKGDRNWFRFLDGYDSSDDPDWLDRYNVSGGEGTPDLWRPREIDMLENGFFKAGDEIFIRFRMFSDPASVGWGWVFDNLRIQEQVVAVEDFVDAKNDFTVFPNPVGGTLNLSLNLKQSAENSVISISDIHGRMISSQTVDLEKNNRTHTIDVSQLPKGVYLVSVRFNKDDVITRKIVK